MRVTADLHIHSRFARACSPELTVPNLSVWGKKKGVNLLATGDFTHPKWFAELEGELEEVREGMYGLKSSLEENQYMDSGSPSALLRSVRNDKNVLFLYGTEIASIYKENGKLRRVHNLVFAPNREAARKINQALEKRGCNIKSDGRPITGLKCHELLQLVKEVDDNCHIVPAHIWTPHFGVFGSLSGFDNLEEAFGEFAKEIFAVETGISSDPAMNWRVPQLDRVTLLSNSDAHSLSRLGREANVFEVEESKLSYKEIFRIIKNKNPKEFLETLEFFPEEGRYHLDGHRDCKFSSEPGQTKQLKGVCPVCGKQILRGVLSRVEELAMRASDYLPKNAVPFKSLVPLDEVIGLALGVGKSSKKVQVVYDKLTAKYSEIDVLLSLDLKELESVSGESVALAILAVRQGKITVVPGYDGEYGRVFLSSLTPPTLF
jgi:uncharacterized protein (TIGR00375 family)